MRKVLAVLGMVVLVAGCARSSPSVKQNLYQEFLTVMRVGTGEDYSARIDQAGYVDLVNQACEVLDTTSVEGLLAFWTLETIGDPTRTNAQNQAGDLTMGSILLAAGELCPRHQQMIEDWAEGR